MGDIYLPPIKSTPTNVNVATLTPKVNGSTNTIDGSYDPSASLQRVFTDDISTFQSFSGKNAMPVILGNPAAYERRAQMQSAGRLTGNALAQFFLGEIVGGTVGGVGTLVAPHKWVERMFDTKDAFERTWLEEVGEMIMEKTRDAFPIYQTQEAQKGMGFGDATWYASLAPSIASAISILIPARAAAILPAKLARMTSQARLAKKLGQVADGAVEARNLGSVARAGSLEKRTTIFASALAGRVIDSSRESLGKYAEYYQENIANGMSEVEARQLAGEAASKGFAMSHLNLAFDLVEWSTILKMSNYAKKGTVDALKTALLKNAKYRAAAMAEGVAEKAGRSAMWGLAADLTKTGLSEGFDEMTMDVFQKEGKYQSDKEHGLTPETSFSERLSDHLKDRKSWDSFIAGAVGGLLMLPMGKVSERMFNKKGIEALNNQVEAAVRHAEEYKSRLEEISKAIEKGDKDTATRLRDDLIVDKASASALQGFAKYDKEMFDNISQMSSEELVENGFNVGLKEYISDISSATESVSKIFEEELDRIRVANPDGTIGDANYFVNINVASLRARKEILERRVNNYEASDEYTMLQKDVANLINTFGSPQAYNYLVSLVDHAREEAEVRDKEDTLKEQLKDLKEQLPIYERFADTETNAINRASARARANNTKALIDSTQKDLDNIVFEYDQVKTKHNLRVTEFVDLAKNDSRLATAKKDVEEYFEQIKPTPSREARKGLYNKFKSDLASVDKLIAFYGTAKGIDSLKAQYDIHKETNLEELKAEIEEELADADEIQLEAFEKKYRNAGEAAIPSSVYKPLVTARKKALKEEAKVKAKQQAREEQTAQAATVTVPEDNSVFNTTTSTTGSANTSSVNTPLLMAPLVIDYGSIYGAAIPTSDEARELISSINATDPTVDNEGKDVSEEEATQRAIMIQTSMHMAKLLDVVLTPEVRELLFKDTKTITRKSTLTEIFDSYAEGKELSKHEGFQSIIDTITPIAKIMGDNIYYEEKSNVRGFELSGKFALPTTDILELFKSASKLDDKTFDLAKDGLLSYLAFVNQVGQPANVLDSFGDGSFEYPSTTSRLIEEFVTSIDESLTRDGKGLLDLISKSNKFLRDIIVERSRAIGAAITDIDVDDIMKVLRDSDEDNTILNERFADIIFAMRTLKGYYENRMARLIDKIKTTPATKSNRHELDIYAKELIALQTMDRFLNLNAIDRVIGETFKTRTVQHTKITQEYIDSWLARHPRSTPTGNVKTGPKAVLNLYDKSGNPIEVSSDNMFELEEGDMGIYEHLEDMQVGAEVEFETDYNFNHQGRLKDSSGNVIPYTDETVPVRVRLKGKDGTNILFVRSLEYYHSGIQYGKLGDNGYEFRGISDVLTDADYAVIIEHMNLLKEFYEPNYKAKYINTSETDKKNAQRAAEVAFNKIKSNEALRTMFLRVVNFNTETTTDKIKQEPVESILNAIFYRVNFEDIHKYKPIEQEVKHKVVNRDLIYASDFAANKSLRESIANNTVDKVTIESISNPGVIVTNPKRNADQEILPRPTLDNVIKQFIPQGESQPRLVFVHWDGFNFRDLHATDESGNAKVFTDKRFNATKARLRMYKDGNRTSGIYAVLQMPSGELMTWGTNQNVIGTSYSTEADRTSAIRFVTDNLMKAVQATRNEDMINALRSTRHVTIYDEHTKPNIVSPKQFYYMQRGWFDEGKWIKIRANVDGKFTWFAIHTTHDGIANIYAHATHPGVSKSILAKNEAEKAYLSTDPTTRNININTPEGLAKLDELIAKRITSYMQRQAHIDIEKQTFTYEKGYEGQPIEDPFLRNPDGTPRTYASAQEYYVKTGAIYSNLGSVEVNGKVVTNFDVRGRFPMTVTLNTTNKPKEAVSVSSVDQLVDMKVIDKNDDYLPIIRMLEAKIKANMTEIVITNRPEGRVSKETPTGTAIAKTWSTRKANKYRVEIYDAYFNQKAHNNDLLSASTNIAHEFIHIFQNKFYKGKRNETPEEYQKRVDAIREHNVSMKRFVDELTTQWNSMSEEAKTQHMLTFLPNITLVQAEAFAKTFDAYVREVNADAQSKTTSFNTKIARGEVVSYIDTIQEPITYAYSNPLVALTLNSLVVLEEGQRFEAGNKRTFWNKLKDAFFKILNRIFNIEFNDRSQFAKLNSLVNTIYARRISEATRQMDTKASIKSKGATPTTVTPEEETKFEEKQEEPEQEMTEEERKAREERMKKIEERGEEKDEEDHFWDATVLDTTYTEYSAVSLADRIESTDFSQSKMLGVITAPQTAILDATGLPIC